MELMTSYERRGMEKGVEKGIQNSIVKILKMKFGPSSNSLQEQVRSIHDAGLLDKVLEKVLASESVDEAQKIVKQLTE
jgi:hypothetical protein